MTLSTKEKFTDTREGKKEKEEDKKYYNKSEIIDLLVSMEPTTDIMDLDEFEQKYYDSTDDFKGMEFSDSGVAEEIINMFIENM